MHNENRKAPQNNKFMGKNSFEKAKDFKKAIRRLFKELKDYKILISLSLVLAIMGSILSILSPGRLSDLTDNIANGLIPNISNMEKLNKTIFDSIYKKTNIDLSKNVNNTNADMSLLNDESLQYILSDIEFNGIEVSVSDQKKYLLEVSKFNEETSRNELINSIDSMPLSIQKLLKPKMDLKKINNVVIILVLMYVTSAVFTFIQAICMTNVSNRFAKKLRNNIIIKTNKLPLKYFDNHSIGDILSRVTNDIDTIAQSMNQSISSLASNATLLLGSIIMMFVTNWIMAITAIFASLIGFVLVIIILSKSQKYFVLKQELLGTLNGQIEETYSGLNVVKSYNAFENVKNSFDSVNSELCKSNYMSQFLSGLMMPLMNFIGNFGYVAVCVVGALLAFKGEISYGVIVAFITYVRLFTNPLSQLAQVTSSFQSTAAASERVFDYFDEKEMTDQKDIVNYLDKSKVKGNISFENISFSYEDNKPIINNFNASTYNGQKIAIVGPTGAGKTTIVNLLMKFYEINEGDIKIDGVSINELTRENIHSLFTMVLQDTWLFEGTIKENIIYNQQNVSDERVKDICKKIGLDHFIRTLPNGYDSIISDNNTVSSGQKQLITIARGMLEDAPFLILDEATSNVDTRTEELVQSAMDKLTEGRTSFIIAHRLSTIKNADLILVIKDGNIVENGTHDKLLADNGFYAELYNSQFEL